MASILTLTLVSITSLSLGIQGQDERQMPTGRDLSVYAKAGPFSLALTTSFAERAETEGLLREFLWRNWRSRQRACAKLETTNKEGERAYSIYYVEPNTDGNWRVIVDVKREIVNRKEPHIRRTETDRLEAHSLRRVEQRRDGLSGYTTIPDAKKPPPQSYRLLLVGDGGKILQEL